jgi:hypothetical protein
MPLFRCKRRVSYVNAYPYSAYSDGLPRFSGRMIEVGAVFEDPPTIGLGVVPQDFEILPDPRDDGSPKTLAEVASACDVLLGWIHAEYVSEPRHIVAARLGQLLDNAEMLPDAPPTPFDVAAMHQARTVPELVRLTKLLRQWSTDLSGSSIAAPSQQRSSQPAGPLFENPDTSEEPPGVGGQQSGQQSKKTHSIPENPDVLRLAKKIKRDREKGLSFIDSAREFCEDDEAKAQSLLRQLRRFPHLLE